MKKMYIILFSLIVMFTIAGCKKNDEIYLDSTSGSTTSELIIDSNKCLNCYAKVYEFSNGIQVYHSCLEIKYKSENGIFSLEDAIDNELIDLEYLKNNGFKIVESNINLNEPLCLINE